jgi:GNAT superfamily N-acetyltransferase
MYAAEILSLARCPTSLETLANASLQPSAQPEAIEIIAYEPQYKEDFKRLNLEWIVYYFTVEPIDIVLLSDPETYFLQPGGAIFFARCCEQIVGTCALLKHPDRGFELSKMGVTRLYRGMHIGQRLVETALAHVKALGEKAIFLETNVKLLPALNLYKKLGFIERQFPHGRSERYQRADTYMVLAF